MGTVGVSRLVEQSVEVLGSIRPGEEPVETGICLVVNWVSLELQGQAPQWLLCRLGSQESEGEIQDERTRRTYNLLEQWMVDIISVSRIRRWLWASTAHGCQFSDPDSRNDARRCIAVEQQRPMHDPAHLPQ